MLTFRERARAMCPCSPYFHAHQECGYCARLVELQAAVRAECRHAALDGCCERCHGAVDDNVSRVGEEP